MGSTWRGVNKTKPDFVLSTNAYIPIHNSFSLIEERTEDIPELIAEENAILMADFTEKKVLHTISQMKTNKAPGADGFPMEPIFLQYLEI
jgi:hypothetical protein